MVWLIIIAALALAIGPIFYLLPSAQDRFLSGLRQHARQLGFSMQLHSLAKLDPTADERVTSSGRQLDPVVKCMCYQWLVREPLNAPPDLILRRLPDAATVPVQEVRPGWGVPTSGERQSLDVAALELIGKSENVQNALFRCVQTLPAAVLALGVDTRSVSLYWREEAAIPRVADEKARLDDGKSLLEELRQHLQTVALALVEAYGLRSNDPS